MFSSIRCPQCTADTGYLVPLSPGHPELSDKQEDWRCVSCNNTQQAKFVNAVTQVKYYSTTALQQIILEHLSQRIF